MIADNQRVGPGRHRKPGILDVEDALEDQLATPALLDPLDIIPVEARVELIVRPVGQRSDVGHALDVADDVAKLVLARTQHAEAPARLGHHVEEVRDGQPGRGTESVLQVLVALAEYLQVEREYQRTT